MALVVGNENYNWDVLEENCEYKEGYTADHPTIQHFWQVFRCLDTKVNISFSLRTCQGAVGLYGKVRENGET
jgi:E3 ubiquitin-protein ligase HERC4